MRKTNLKKLAAVVLSAAMVLSMGGMTAFAAEQDVATLEFTKTITKAENVYVPAVGTIEFEVVPGEAGTDANKKIVMAGIEDGLNVTDQATFTVDSTTLADTTVSDKVTLTINPNVFYDNEDVLMPGIYRYELTEKNHNYDGLSYDNTNYYVDVYVTEEIVDGNAVDTFKAVMYKSTDSSSKLENVENVYTTNKLTVEKEVTGNQGDKNEKFNFTITINGVKGESYYYLVNDTVQENALVCNDDGVATLSIALAHGDKVEIVGLSEKDTFTVVEAEANENEYNTTYKVNGADVDAINSVEEGNADKAVVVENNKTVTTPTGIALTFAPYALLVALAGVFGFFFLRKKREEEV